MFKIANNEIQITRGDKGNIPVKIPINEEETEFYQFKIGDKIKIGVYKKGKLNENAVILKEFEVSEPTDTFLIPLTSEDTKIGELINKETEYWYEIILNDSETILGYEKDKNPKLFWLLPEGSDKK